MTPVLDAVRREELRKAKIDYSGFSVDQLRHYLRIRDRQAMTSRAYWLRAAKKARDGDPRELANRIDLAEMGRPVTIANGDTEGTFNAVPGAELADDIDAMLAYIAELEAGLRPFAEAADSLDEHRRDTSEIWEDPAAMAITAGDLRRAAALRPKASVREERG